MSKGSSITPLPIRTLACVEMYYMCSVQLTGIRLARLWKNLVKRQNEVLLFKLFS